MHTGTPLEPVKAKDYSQDRPQEVQNELDDLRNRGIAKVLNRHFTDTTKKLAKEKAAADAALADLERRRANTSEFVPSHGGELNSFDSMYVQLQQRRAECRRKERETILLYQRYVYKYGKKTNLSVPNPKFVPKLRQETASPSPSTSSNASTPEAPPPPSPSPIESKIRALQSLDENAVTVLTPEEFAHNQMMQHLAPEEHKNGTYSSVDSTELSEGDNSVSIPVTDVRNMWEKQANENSFKQPQVAEMTLKTGDMTPPESVESTSSPPASPFDALAPTVDKQEIGSITSDSLRPTREVTTEMLTTDVDDDDDEDDRSVISGLTMNSQLTRQVMEEIEQEKAHFLKIETEAIRRMLDEEDEKSHSSRGMNSGSSLVGDASKLASIRAEAMVREMQQILDEYTKEDQSVSIQTEESISESTTTGTAKYPRDYAGGNPGEEWMVYFDESCQREYYFEKKTKRTQWEVPIATSSSESQATHAVLLPGEVTGPVRRPRSRKEMYRRKLRKRRIRRLASMSVLTALAGATVLHWKRNHNDKTYPDAMMATWHTASEMAVDSWNVSSQSISHGMEYSMQSIMDLLNKIKVDSSEGKRAESTNFTSVEEFTSVKDDKSVCLNTEQRLSPLPPVAVEEVEFIEEPLSANFENFTHVDTPTEEPQAVEENITETDTSSEAEQPETEIDVDAQDATTNAEPATEENHDTKEERKPRLPRKVVKGRPAICMFPVSRQYAPCSKLQRSNL